MRVVLYNDTALINTHFGPQLVVQTVREQFAKHGVELIGSLHRDARPQDNRALLSRADLVIVNGEGSVHHGKCGHLIDLANEYPAALINCVYQDNSPNEGLPKFRLIAARESRSARHLLECGAIEVQVVPDLMFGSTILREFVPDEPVFDLGMTDNVTNRESGHPPFVSDATDYLRWLSQHRRMVCGRYHAAVACGVLGIPFTCWPSNTWKIEGMLDDIGLPELLCQTQQEAVENCPVSFDAESKEKIGRYIAAAQIKIDSLFAQLVETKA
jgi:hypothetical protein